MSDIEQRLRYTEMHGVFDAVDAGMYASPSEVADTIARLRAAFPQRIGRLTLGERLSHEHYCGGSHEMPDGQPIYWQERGGEFPDDIEGFCLTCAIQNAESDAGWCECSVRAALEGEG